jgi:hypothetical protein
VLGHVVLTLSGEVYGGFALVYLAPQSTVQRKAKEARAASRRKGPAAGPAHVWLPPLLISPWAWTPPQLPHRHTAKHCSR